MQLVPKALTGKGARLNESPKDGAQQLSQHVEASSAPGRVACQAVCQRYSRVHVPARHICCRIDLQQTADDKNTFSLASHLTTIIHYVALNTYADNALQCLSFKIEAASP